MVTAALRLLLYSGSEDNANVVANSVTVLFIADLVSGVSNAVSNIFLSSLEGYLKGGGCRIVRWQGYESVGFIYFFRS